MVVHFNTFLLPVHFSRKIIYVTGYFLDAVKLQVLDNLLFVLDTEVCVMLWFSLRFTIFLIQLYLFYKIKLLIFTEDLDLTVGFFFILLLGLI